MDILRAAQFLLGGIEGGRELPYKKDGVKKAVMVLLRVFNLKRPTAGASVVLFRVLSRKYMTGDI